MAEIVLGIGTSHTPQMSSTVKMWDDHAARDRGNPQLLASDGEYWRYEDLLEVADPTLESELTDEVWNRKYERAQECVEILAKMLEEAKPDVVVVVGDDQEELFDDDGTPSIGLFLGEEVWDRPLVGVRKERLEKYPGLMAAQWAAHGPQPTPHQIEMSLSRHLALSLTDSEFDLTLMSQQPEDKTLGHAFTFPRYRLHLPQTTPIVPILLNTYFQPNVPSASRCYDLGVAIRKGIESWEEDKRVVVIASGGLSHFVVLPEWDMMVLDAMKNHDRATLAAIPRKMLRSGTSETLNWITVAGVFERSSMEIIDYLPGFRTPAGTGTGMAFAVWR
jgi:hypothetical protein